MNIRVAHLNFCWNLLTTPSAPLRNGAFLLRRSHPSLKTEGNELASTAVIDFDVYSHYNHSFRNLWDSSDYYPRQIRNFSKRITHQSLINSQFSIFIRSSNPTLAVRPRLQGLRQPHRENRLPIESEHPVPAPQQI